MKEGPPSKKNPPQILGQIFYIARVRIYSMSMGEWVLFRVFLHLCTHKTALQKSSMKFLTSDSHSACASKTPQIHLICHMKLAPHAAGRMFRLLRCSAYGHSFARLQYLISCHLAWVDQRTHTHLNSSTTVGYLLEVFIGLWIPH